MELNHKAAPALWIGQKETKPAYPESYLEQDYNRWLTLYQAQSIQSRKLIDSQAKILAAAIVNHERSTRFVLPLQVIVDAGTLIEADIPARLRAHHLGSMLARMKPGSILSALQVRLRELEESASVRQPRLLDSSA